MKRQLKRGIAMLLGMGAFCGLLAGCRGGTGANPPGDITKTPTSVIGGTDTGAVLRTAKSYEEVYAALERIPKNNGNYWLKEIVMEDGAVSDAVMDSTMNRAESSLPAPESDFSNTNVQVEGIDEADIIKTDGSYLYILDRTFNRIFIVSVREKDERVVARISVDSAVLGSVSELYLAEDRLIAVTERSVLQEESEETEENRLYYLYSSSKRQVGLITYDISDRTAPRQLSALWQDGRYLSSRCVGGYVYTFSDYYCGQYYVHPLVESQPKKTEETAKEDTSTDTRIPCVNEKMVEPDCIYLCDEPNEEEFLVLTAMKAAEPFCYADTKTVMSGGNHCYVSSNYIYIGSSRWESIKHPYNRTELYRFSYGDGRIEAAGQTTVKGNLNDQFSMDEYKGMLRIVTTVTEYDYTGQKFLEQMEDNNEDGVVDEKDLNAVYDAFWWLYPEVSSRQSNALYIYDERLALVGSIEHLAEDEHIEAARLMGDTGYFVTFRQVDPLFSVDLSDPTSPKVLGALKIPGFSEYLHPFGENLLLGIGYEADENTGRSECVKLSMFDVSDPSDVKEAAKLILPRFSKSITSHKDILVDVSRNLIGFPVYGCENGEDYYVYCVYGYQDGKGFYQKMTEGYSIPWNDYSSLTGLAQQIRGMYIGDTFYLIQPAYEVRMFALDTWEQTGRVLLSEQLEEERNELE